MNNKPGLFARHSLAAILLLVFATAPLMAADRQLKIKTRHVLAVQGLTAEVTSMLQDLGYERKTIRDPTTEQPVQVASDGDEYKMLFKHVEHPLVIIRVRVREANDLTKLDFSDKGADSDVSRELFSKLKKRVEFQFGASNVREK